MSFRCASFQNNICNFYNFQDLGIKQWHVCFTPTSGISILSKKRENCKSSSSLEIPELANTSEDAVSLVSLHSKKRKPLVFDGRSHRITHKKSRFANCLLVGLSQDYLRKLVFNILGSLGSIFTLTCCRFPTFCIL